MESLSVKWRPKSWAEIVGQNIVVSILCRQLTTSTWKNAYLFCGPHGCGKTTAARLFARDINNGEGFPIEIDAASNSGIDNVRNIISDAQQGSVISDYKCYVVDECVTGDTEILTECGWKRFDMLDGSERVAQYCNDGNVEFVKPSELVVMDYSGDMYNISIGNRATFTMSPNHVQPLYYTKSHRIKERYIKDVKFNQHNKLVRSGRGSGPNQHLSIKDRLAICLQADGTLQRTCANHNYWTIMVKKPRKKARLADLLSSYDGEYSTIKSRGDGYVRYSIKTDKDITKKLSTHFDLSAMSYTYAKEFIDEVMEWDGSVCSGYKYYSCVDKDNADFCQSVGVLCELSSRIAMQKDTRSVNHKDCYRVYFMDCTMNKGNAYVRKERVSFTGKIYCVKVPSHMIVIRKDNYEMVTGNCHQLSKAAWDAMLKIIEEPPTNVIFIFCTTNPAKIPDTILSRVQRFDFNKVPSKLIADRLEFIVQEDLHIPYTREALEAIAIAAKGHVRDAIQLLDKCISVVDNLNTDNVSNIVGFVDYTELANIENAVIVKDLNSCMKAYEKIKLHSSLNCNIYNSITEFAVNAALYALTKDKAIVDIPDNVCYNLNNNFEIANLFVDRLINFAPYITEENADIFLKTIFMEMCK